MSISGFKFFEKDRRDPFKKVNGELGAFKTTLVIYGRGLGELPICILSISAVATEDSDGVD